MAPRTLAAPLACCALIPATAQASSRRPYVYKDDYLNSTKTFAWS